MNISDLKRNAEDIQPVENEQIQGTEETSIEQNEEMNKFMLELIKNRFKYVLRALKVRMNKGVTLEENMIFSPTMPQASESISSVYDEQSQPQPTDASSLTINGLGVALTAKYSLKPLFQENASYKRFAKSVPSTTSSSGMMSN